MTAFLPSKTKVLIFQSRAWYFCLFERFWCVAENTKR